MARFYRLQLESIYFTSDGSAVGVPCRIALGGVERLLSDYVITPPAFNNDGSPVLETVETGGAGVELVADILGSIKDTVFDDLNELIQTALDAGATLTLVASGGSSPAGFTREVVAFTPTKAGFSGSRIKGAQFRFLTI